MAACKDQDSALVAPAGFAAEVPGGTFDPKRLPPQLSLQTPGSFQPKVTPATPAQQFLQETKLKDVALTAQQVVTLDHDMTISHALRKLAKHKILSAPLIVNVGLEDTESIGPVTGGPSLLGWVDISDLVKDFLRHLKQHKHQLPGNMLALMKLLETEGTGWTERPLVTLVDSHDMELVFQHEEDTSLLTAINDLFLHPKGQAPESPGTPGSGPRPAHRIVHRLAVFDAYGSVTAVISQMDIVRYLAHHTQQLGELGSQTLQQLGLVDGEHSKVFTVDAHTPTLLALDAMQKASARGAAVLSDTGDLVANLSMSDLRGVEAEHLGALALPVAEFLALLHGTSYLGYSQGTSNVARHPFFAGAANSPSAEDQRIYTPITATASSTFAEVLAMMAGNRVHRVYVLDQGAAGRKVCAVVTTTDCLRLVANAQQAH